MVFLNNLTNIYKVNYNFKKLYNWGNIIDNNLNSNIIPIINNYFDTLSQDINCKYIISNPTYTISNDVINITILYYCTSSTVINNYKHISLSSEISKIVNKKVNINLIRIYYPYMNSSIFSKYLSYNSNDNNYLHFQDSIIQNINLIKNTLPSYITGIKIIISGRIVTEAIIPRITKKSFSYGTFKGNNKLIDYNIHTSSNRIGTFTFKVWICQRIQLILF